MNKWKIFRKYSTKSFVDFELDMVIDIQKRILYFSNFNSKDNILRRAEFKYGEYEKIARGKFGK